MAVKPDRKNFMFTDKKDETLIKKKGELNGLNFKIRNLQNCTVYLLDHTNGLFIDDCTNCKIIVAPCDGSVMIRTSKNCSISIVAKQLRFRDCENIQIYSYIESEPVVESCSEIHFSPYNAFLPAQEELFVKANFTPKKNTFHLVYDFTEKVNTEVIHWDINLGNIEKEIVKIEGIEEAIQGLYPDYEEEFDYYVNNKHLPYNTEKVVVEGENIPIDTNLNIKANDEIKLSSLNTNNNEINNTNNLNDNNQQIIQENYNNFFDDNNKVNPSNTNFINPQNNNNINNFFESNVYSDPFNDNNLNQINTKPNQVEDIEITNSYNYVNPPPSNEEVFNIQSSFNASNSNFNYGMSDPEEFEAEKKRKLEEQNKIKQIMEKQMKEQNTKIDIKNKAREYLDNFNQKRQKAVDSRHRSNIEEEKVFIETRENAKQSTKNPWDRVVSLIDLKESEYKGTKNVDRMRQCIINRRYDFSKNLNQ